MLLCWFGLTILVDKYIIIQVKKRNALFSIIWRLDPVWRVGLQGGATRAALLSPVSLPPDLEKSELICLCDRFLAGRKNSFGGNT